MDPRFTFILLFFIRRAFLAYKEISLFLCKDGKNGWEDFSPELNRKDHVGFFEHILGISVVVVCFS